jgi:hypothetical protein
MASYKIDFRIGTSFNLPPPFAVTNFIALIHRGLPAPDRWTFTPYSTTKVRGDGRSIGDGYPTASWTWEVLSQQQLDNLLRFFASDADASVAIYIRTPTERGFRVEPGDYTAIMHRPIMGDSKTMIPDSTAPVWEEVTVQFTRLVPR